ncbi:MAG: hypothetical protein KGZ25_13645 [Planctomycetes bacterium]|nr:hypothetical protein [Planctomycetota bacterium]
MRKKFLLMLVIAMLAFAPLFGLSGAREIKKEELTYRPFKKAIYAYFKTSLSKKEAKRLDPNGAVYFDKRPKVMILNYAGVNSDIQAFCLEQKEISRYSNSKDGDIQSTGTLGYFSKLGGAQFFGVRQPESETSVGIFAEKSMFHFPLFPRQSRQLATGDSWEMKIVPVYAVLKPPYGIGIAKPSQTVEQELVSREDILGHECVKVRYSYRDTYKNPEGGGYGYDVSGVSFFSLTAGLIVKQLESVRVIVRPQEKKKFIEQEGRIEKKILLIHHVPFTAKERNSVKLSDPDYSVDLLKKNFRRQPPEILKAIEKLEAKADDTEVQK